jgi:hypothetical protein
MILANVNDGCISIGGLPYAKGHLFCIFDEATGKIGFRRVNMPAYDLVGPFHYSDYINQSTGLAFTSFSDVVSWIETFNYPIPVGGGGSTIAFMKHLFVKNSPVAADEVAPGASIAHTFLDGGTVQVVYVNGSFYGEGDFSHTPGELTLTDREFMNGDKLLILKNP